MENIIIDSKVSYKEKILLFLTQCFKYHPYWYNGPCACKECGEDSL